MIIYLDFNKWIELATFENKKDTSDRACRLLNEYRAAKDNGCIFPLSLTHYLEFSRISNLGRRKRLGSVMWKYSQGKTLLSYRYIVEREIEIALQNYFPEIIPRRKEIIGQGVDFAFDVSIDSSLYKDFKSLFNKGIIMGDDRLNIEPISSKNLIDGRVNFLNHLKNIHKKKNELERLKWDDWLHAISMVDIIEPINRVFSSHNIDFSFLSSSEEARRFLHLMPTRYLDIHLHRQVLKNPAYKPKITDLEDWSGIGLASYYCDVVICEKHFADMLGRDKYKPKARVETKLENLLESIV